VTCSIYSRRDGNKPGGITARVQGKFSARLSRGNCRKRRRHSGIFETLFIILSKRADETRSRHNRFEFAGFLFYVTGVEIRSLT